MRGDPLDIIERASLVSSSSSSSSSSDETAKKVAKKSSLTSSKVEPGDTSDSSASSASEVEYLYKQVKITKAHKILPPKKIIKNKFENYMNLNAELPRASRPMSEGGQAV